MTTSLRKSVKRRHVREGGIAVVGCALLAAVSLQGTALAEHPGIPLAKPVDQQVASYAPDRSVAGRLTIAGSDTMHPLLVKLANDFTRRQPDVRFVIENVTSGEAIKEFIHGYSFQLRPGKAKRGHHGSTELNILASSRKMTEKEIAVFTSANGYEPLAIPVAMDAVTVYVHKDNPTQGLTLAQVEAMFGSERKRGHSEDIKTWGQLGLAGSWQDLTIRLYGRNKGSGTRDFFKHIVLLDGELKDGVKEVHGSASEILAIARDPQGIGYAGTGFQTSYVKAVPIAEEQGRPAVAPSLETVLNGSYPLRRQLYLYVDKGDMDPVLEEFLRFVNSREGQQTVVRANLYPLSKDEVESNLALLKGDGVQTAAMPSNSKSKPD